MTRPRNDNFLRALFREPTERTPVWLMRQAGRYLPEYRETRKRAGSFMQLCKSPALACEVALQPLACFDLDAVILFSDILTVPDAMGLGLHFAEGEGPRFERPLREAREAFERLYFEHHLRGERGNMTRVADKTGLERTHLYRKLKQLGLNLGRRSDDPE